jgi:hypothetical protein
VQLRPACSIKRYNTASPDVFRDFALTKIGNFAQEPDTALSRDI